MTSLRNKAQGSRQAFLSAVTAVCAAALLGAGVSPAAAETATFAPGEGENWGAEVTSYTVDHSDTITVTLKRPGASEPLHTLVVWGDVNGDKQADFSVSAGSIEGLFMFNKEVDLEFVSCSDMILTNTSDEAVMSFPRTCLLDWASDYGWDPNTDFQNIRFGLNPLDAEGNDLAEIDMQVNNYSDGTTSIEYGAVLTDTSVPYTAPAVQKIDSTITAEVEDPDENGDVAGAFTVAAADGATPEQEPTGEVTWTLAGKEQTAAKIGDDGTAAFTLTGVDAGTYDVTAAYAGDDRFNASEYTGKLTITDVDDTTSDTDPEQQTTTTPTTDSTTPTTTGTNTPATSTTTGTTAATGGLATTGAEAALGLGILSALAIAAGGAFFWNRRNQRLIAAELSES